MQQGDYTSSPYYQFPQQPTPAPTHNHPPPSYASAPPFSTTNYSAPPPPQPQPQPTSDFSSFQSSYPSYPQIPDHLPTAPSYTPPQSQPQQPQFAPLFPQFESHGTYQPPNQSYSSYGPSFDQPKPTPNPNPIANSPYPSNYPSQFTQLSSSTPPSHGIYDNIPKFDQSSHLLSDTSANYNRNVTDYDRNVTSYDRNVTNYDRNATTDYDQYGSDGVYAYQGSKVEPYGSRGTAPKSSTWSTSFDDFGRPIGTSSNKDRPSSGSGSASSTKIVRAVPKAESIQDVKGGVQKFKVKVLSESYGQSTMEVLCQVGLDGIRMLDPSSGRMLRIYPLETVTRCEATESTVFTFWSKSSVDIEPRRIRLQSNTYTTNTILDTVTAATVQFKEMGGRSRVSESPTMNEQQQPSERKKGFSDWINIIKPVNEEKDHWVPDEAISKCTSCGSDFGAFVRKHHCRNCGDIFCDKCTNARIALTADEDAPVVRVCDRCKIQVSRRLSNANNRSVGLQTHEDLAKKLQEEMERNRKSSSSTARSDTSTTRMKEVACPTCTVHLQVQVPTSGSQTIECGVCQHPFLVTSH